MEPPTIAEAAPAEPVLAWVDTATGSLEARGKPKRLQQAIEDAAGEREAYASWFLLPDDFPAWVREHGGIRGYEATRPIHSAKWLWIDIDRRNGKTGEPDVHEALLATRGIVGALREMYEVDPRNLLVYFSGSKGFHICAPMLLFGGRPHVLLNKALRRMAIELCGEKNTDVRIYDLVRLCRCPNTQHGKSGLWKISLTTREVQEISARDLTVLAAAPRSIEDPGPYFVPPEGPAELPAALFEKCLSAAEEEDERDAIRREEIASGATGPVGVGGYLNLTSLGQIADLVGPYWREGQRHDVCMALCGYLATHGIPRDEAGRCVEYICGQRGDDEAQDRVKLVTSTYDLMERGQASAVFGFRGLEKLGMKATELTILERAVKRHAVPVIRPAPGVAAPASLAGTGTDPATTASSPGPAGLPGVPGAPGAPGAVPASAITWPGPDDWDFRPEADIPRQPTPPMLVENLISGNSRCVVSGEPKGAMKTWWCLQLAISVATATPFLDHYPILTPGPVTYYSGEEPTFLVQERTEKIKRALGMDGRRIPLYFANPEAKLRVRFDIQAHVDRMRRMIDAIRPVMVVFEPLAHLHHLDENDAQALLEGVLEPLTNVVLETGVTLVVAHHVSKDTLRAGGARMRGSTAIWGWYDAGYHAHKPAGKDYVRMEFEHRRLRDQPDLCYQIEDGTCSDGVSPHAKLVRVERNKADEMPEKRKRRSGGAGPAPAGSIISPSASAAWIEEQRNALCYIQHERAGATATQLKTIFAGNTLKAQAMIEELAKQGFVTAARAGGRVTLTQLGSQWMMTANPASGAATGSLWGAGGTTSGVSVGGVG